MQDGRTRKVQQAGSVGTGSEEFLESNRAVLVTLSGTTAGNEYEIECDPTSIGRGPGVELAFDDSTMSREHATFEIVEGAVRLRDLGSTNGVLVNGAPVAQVELEHGDRISLGEHEFQFILDERKRAPKVYDVSGG